jgi:glutaconyl-CoA decarboxylase
MTEHVLKIGGKEYRAEVIELTSGRAKVVVNEVEYDVELVSLGRKKIAPMDIASRPAVAPPPSPIHAPAPAVQAPQRTVSMLAGQSAVLAPMPGSIFQMRVKEGQQVQAGQVLLVMEAMKMENPVNAPIDGTVAKVLVREGDNVGEGDLLIEIARPQMTTM